MNPGSVKGLLSWGGKVCLEATEEDETQTLWYREKLKYGTRLFKNTRVGKVSSRFGKSYKRKSSTFSVPHGGLRYQ